METLKAYFNSNFIGFDGDSSCHKKGKSVVVKTPEELKKFLDEYLENEKTGDVILGGYDIQQLFADFKKYFKYLAATGGLVKNDRGQYLLIKRFGIWDLPKGKIEKKESPESAAIREVEEETAVDGLSIAHKLKPTYHIYYEKEKWILKKTFWFLMTTNSQKVLVPQLDEKITEAVWLGREETIAALAGSYKSLADNFSPLP